MTPGSQQPKEYIITEEQLERALAYRSRVLKFMEPNERKDWENFIAGCRSRPHPAASEQEIRADVISKLTKIKGSFSVLEMRRSDEYKEAYDQINELVIELRRQPPGGTL